MASDFSTDNTDDLSSRPDFVKVGLRIAAEVCLPLLIVVGILSYSEYRRRVANVMTELKTHETHQVEIIAASLSGRLSEPISDIKMLAQSPLAIGVFIHPEDFNAKMILAHELEIMAYSSNIYDQIRLLDLDGEEVLRISYRDDSSYLVPREHLQNKKHRYYFEQLSELGPDEIFISPMDLKKEYGKIELPCVPTIRIGKKVFSREKPVGIAILSYKADLICDIFAESSDISAVSETYLLNADGYWLSGVPPDKCWGFMFPDRMNVSYADEHPQLWDVIFNSSGGQFEKDGYIVTFRRMGDLTSVLPATRPSRDHTVTQLQLIIVSQLSPQKIASVVNGIRFGVALTSAIFSTLLIISIVAFIMFRQQRRYLRQQARLHAMELERQSKQLAADIQNMLLLEPITEKSEHYEFARILRSCQHVGGDFIGYWKFESAGDILIGDVMGKGIAGALLAAATKIQFANAFRDAFLRQHHLPSPRQIVDYVRDNISDTLLKLDRFVSLNFARLNLEDHTIEFIDCGHTRPILYRRSEDKVIFLEGGNMPLGFLAGEKSQQVKYDIHGDDLIMFYSDGVTEARNIYTRELFGTERLIKFIRENCDMPVERIITELEHALSEFQGNNVFADDLTCIVIRINPDGPR